jgi:hypothetical protein
MFSPSTSISSANHFTNFPTIIITRGWHNRPFVAVVPSGPNLTLHPTIPIKLINWLFGWLILRLEDGDYMFLLNIGSLSTDHTKLYLKRQVSSSPPL